MLESITQQLARNDNADSIDAYQTLSSTLKAYSEVPDTQNMKLKLGCILQQIRRDLLVMDKTDVGPADINLVTQALKVLVILAWNRNFAILLSNENQGFILDRAIQTVEEHKAPKGVILHYLHLLATQDFRQNIIASNGRVTRLLDALKDLTSHVKGNGAVSERIMVYQRLIDQAKSVMKAKPLSWIPELLEGLVNPSKDTRTKAVDLGTKAVAAFSSSSTISHALRTVLDTTQEDGKTIGASTSRRLEKMLSSKEDGLMVPQIWAIVLSLLRGIEGRIDKWPGLKDWLKVIQKCFNCSNSNIRSQANLAWNRFVYVVRPSEATESLLGMLIKPIAAQLERKSGEKEDRTTRASAFAAYCNLLYYAFRPAASHKQYDRVWEEYIVKVLTKSFFEKGPANADRVCRMFMALYWNDNSRSKLWREIRAQENILMEPEELPTIDCKWVRAHASSALNIFKLLFRNGSWGSASSPEQSFVAVAWRHFSKALGDACRKEMKPSNETKKALADVLTCLRDVWQSGPIALNAVDENTKDAFLSRFRFVCITVLAEIGPIPLTEGSLSGELSDAGKDASVASEGQQAPIFQLMKVLGNMNGTGGTLVNDTYHDLVKEVLELPRQGRMPPTQRIRLLRQCADAGRSLNSANRTDGYVWRAVASLVNAAMVDLLTDPPPGATFDRVPLQDDALHVLEIGVACIASDEELWCNILRKLINLTQAEDGSVARTWSIIKSLTMSFKKQPEGRLTIKIAELVLHVTPLMHTSVNESHQRHVMGNLRAKVSNTTSPFFEKLLGLLNDQLENAYKVSWSDGEATISRTVFAICQCLKMCRFDTTDRWLKIMDVGLGLWLEDSQRLLTSCDPIGLIKLTEARKMYPQLMEVLKNQSERDDNLKQVSMLLAAGFRSTHKLTINHMIKMWNSSYGTKKQLAYPPELKAALERLRPYVDIELPGFGIDTGNESSISPPAFVDSQEDEVVETVEPAGSTHSRLAKSSATNLLPQKGVHALFPASVSRSSPLIERVTPLRTVPKPKLRHDDSQLQFVAIESSPLQDVEIESQIFTERQKEIRARQQAEPAVVFPDLRSSPSRKPNVAKASFAEVLTEDMVQNGDVEMEAPATPTLPAQPDGEDDAMPSSPTPQSKHPALRLDEIEVPSSPPSMPTITGYEVPEQPRLDKPQTKEANVPSELDQVNVSEQRVTLEDSLNLSHSEQEQSVLEHREDSHKFRTDDEAAESFPELSTVPSSDSKDETPVPDNVLLQSIEAVVEVADVELADAQISQTSSITEALHNDNSTQAEKVGVEVQDENMNDVPVPDNEDAGNVSEIQITNPEEQTSEQDAMTAAQASEAASVAAEPREQIMKDPPPLEPDSDEVDMLSASQLSQDLDWHIEVEARASQSTRSPEVEISHITRKRKRSVGSTTSIKRRKATTSPSHPAHQLPQLRSGTSHEAEMAEEIFDCIVVDTTPRLPRAAAKE